MVGANLLYYVYMFVIFQFLEQCVINEVKSFLSKSFDMKDLGEANAILNIKLLKDESGITLSQSHYVEKVGFMDSKPSPTPYDPSVTLRKNKKIARDQLRYS